MIKENTFSLRSILMVIDVIFKGFNMTKTLKASFTMDTSNLGITKNVQCNKLWFHFNNQFPKLSCQCQNDEIKPEYNSECWFFKIDKNAKKKERNEIKRRLKTASNSFWKRTFWICCEEKKIMENFMKNKKECV